MGQVFMGEKIILSFDYFCLHKARWGYYGKAQTLTFRMGISHGNVYFSLWKCFKKEFIYLFWFFSFPLRSSANPCSEGSTWPLLTMAALPLLIPHLQYLVYHQESLFWGVECHLLFKAVSSETWKSCYNRKWYYCVDFLKPVRDFCFFKKKKKREWKSLIFPPQWSFHFEHVFIWILIQKQSAVSLNQVIPNSEAPVNHLELNPWRFSQPCHRGRGTLLQSSRCLWT